MNKVLLVLLLFISQLCATAQIDIALDFQSVKGRKFECYRYEFELYKKDSLITTVECSPIMENVFPGIYTIKYYNLYSIEKEITFNTDTLTNNSITIYFDWIDYNSIKINSFIDLIRDNKPLTIDMQYRGCFHAASDKWVIKKKGDVYVLYYDVYEKILSETELNLIRDFEKELHSLPSDAHCTSQTSYFFLVGNKKKKFIDYTCEWDGIENLKKNLDLKDYKIKKTDVGW